MTAELDSRVQTCPNTVRHSKALFSPNVVTVLLYRSKGAQQDAMIDWLTEKCQLAGMEALVKQLDLLNGEVKDVASEIKELYDKSDRETDAKKQAKLDSRIEKLEAKERAIFSERTVLYNKLEAGGIPKNNLLLSIDATRL